MQARDRRLEAAHPPGTLIATDDLPFHASAHHSTSDSLQWLRSIESPWGEHPLLHHPCEWPRDGQLGGTDGWEEL